MWVGLGEELLVVVELMAASALIDPRV